MLKLKNSQKGFGLIEGLLIIIAVTLIAFVGYYVYHSQQKSDQTLNQATTASQSSPAESSAPLSAADKEAALQAYLLKTCSSDSSDDIKAVFKNQANQTVDTDNVQIDGNYAIVNISSCKLADGTDLTTLLLKNTGTNWKLVHSEASGISCDYLTSQGFPEKLRAPYCQNQGAGEGDFGAQQ